MAITTPVSFWKMDESSGNAADAVGSNTLTNTGVVFAAGKINNAADFERGDSTDVLSIADGSQSGLDFSNKMSISAWVYLESTPSNIGSIVSKWNPSAASNLAYRFAIDYDNDRLQLDTSGTGTNELLSYCSWNPSLSTWYHIVVTYDGALSSGSRVKLYINGTSQTLAADAAPSSLFNSNQSFNIGQNGTNRQFDGLIDAVGVWNVVLTSTEVSELYNSGNGIQYPFSVFYTLAADLGAFTLTGIAASLTKGYRMAADLGSYILTGYAAMLSASVSMAASVGSFTLTGIDAALSRGYNIVADTGTFALTLLDVAVSRGLSMVADVGSFTLTGIAAGLSRGYHLAADVGSYVLTGFAARFPIIWRAAAKNVASWINQNKTNI